MEGLYNFLSFLGGTLVRLGLPIGLTVLVMWWLRKLDIGWQHEAEQVNRGQVVASVRCWEKKGCPPENLAACKAYKNQQTPCWQVFRSSNGQLKRACVGCRVLQEAPIPVYR